MSRIMGSPKKKADRNLAQIGLLTTVPTILLVAPLVGFFLGKWADKKLGTDPYLMILGVVLGLASAVSEIINLVRKAEEIEKRNEDND